MLFRVPLFEARVVSTAETLVICNQSAPNQSAANTAGRAAMWPQIGRSILTSDHPKKDVGADPGKKPFPTKGKGKGKGKSKGKGKGKRNKLRELEDGEEWEAEEEGEDPEVDEDQDQVAMMVLAKSTESTEGVGASTSEPVVHSVTHPLEYLLSTQGLGKDLKTHWLVDSGATCHIVAEEWLKLYKVKHWYPASAPTLRGAGDHILPTAGMVDLEFKVGPVVMQRVVVARIKLNVISCYALSETGWLTRLGGAHESVLENGQGTNFHLGRSDQTQWQSDQRSSPHGG